MGYFIIATDDKEKNANCDCLVAEINENTIKSIWHINVEDKKVQNIKSFPVDMLQSFYAHSNGMISCKIPCPEFIVNNIENRSAEKVFSDKEKLSKLFGVNNENV